MDTADVHPITVLQLSNSDPELGQLLKGEAPAELELQVVTGQWADTAPTQQERQEAATAARIQEILDATNGNPWGQPGEYLPDGSYQEPVPGNLTMQMSLQALDSNLAAQLKTAATPPAPQQGLTQEGANFVNQQLFSNYIGAA